MTEDNETIVAKAGEYALGLMSPAEARAFENDLSRDPVARAAYADWAEGLVTLETDDAPPPASAKVQIDKRLFLGAAVPQNRWRLWAGRGLAFASLILAGFLAYSYMTGPFYDYQAETASADLTFDVRVDLESRTVLASALTQSPPADRSFEFWIIPDQGTPISLGVLAARDQLTVPGDFDITQAVIAVTVEDLGGSPDGSP
ncbi:MAG: anti-sigma factor, partial [Pseudomonadota bacterium]